MLLKVVEIFGFLFSRHRPPPVPDYNAGVVHRVWQAAFDSATEASPEEIAADLRLPWTVREAAEWKHHCSRCASCGAWMYDPLTDHCHRCRDW